MSHRPHDALFKAAFVRPEHAQGMLRGLLPHTIATTITWATLRLEPGSFVDPDLADSHSDMLFSAELTTRSRRVPRVQLYLLLEHQSTSDPVMPLRLLSYMVRIWERCERDREAAQPRRGLPLIVPIVISHAPGGWSTARDLAALIDPGAQRSGALQRFVPRFDVVIEDLAHLSNDDIKGLALAAFPKLVLWALRDARSGEELIRNFDQWTSAILEAYRAPMGVQALAQLVRYITLVSDNLQLQQIRDRLREVSPQIEEEAMTIAEQMRREGREEGREEGRTEERVAVLRKLLELKFGALDEAQLARIRSATPEQRDAWVERVLTAAALADVLGD